MTMMLMLHTGSRFMWQMAISGAGAGMLYLTEEASGGPMKRASLDWTNRCYSVYGETGLRSIPLPDTVETLDEAKAYVLSLVRLNG